MRRTALLLAAIGVVGVGAWATFHGLGWDGTAHRGKPALRAARSPRVRASTSARVNVHLQAHDTDCLACHVNAAGGELIAPSVRELCRRCHPASDPHTSHPLDVALPAAMKTTLPLEANRTLGCLTCHAPHGKEGALLRRTPAHLLCGECHPRH